MSALANGPFLGAVALTEAEWGRATHMAQVYDTWAAIASVWDEAARHPQTTSWASAEMEALDSDVSLRQRARALLAEQPLHPGVTVLLAAAAVARVRAAAWRDVLRACIRSEERGQRAR